MDMYREEKQIILAIIVFSAFILGVVSTTILPQEIISTIMAYQNYKAEVEQTNSASTYAKDNSDTNVNSEVLGATSNDSSETTLESSEDSLIPVVPSLGVPITNIVEK